MLTPKSVLVSYVRRPLKGSPRSNFPFFTYYDSYQAPIEHQSVKNSGDAMTSLEISAGLKGKDVASSPITIRRKVWRSVA